jgi:hypothetical protein
MVIGKIGTKTLVQPGAITMFIIDLSFLLLDSPDRAKPISAPIPITALYLPPSAMSQPEPVAHVIASNTEQAAIENWFASSSQIDEVELKPSENSVVDTESTHAEKRDYINEQAYAHNNSHESHTLEP